MKGALGLALLLATSIIAGCNSANSAGSSMLKVALGPHVFHIPEKNSLEGKRPFWIDWIPGLDDGSRDTNIVFSREEVMQAIPGFRSEMDVYGTDFKRSVTDVEGARVTSESR